MKKPTILIVLIALWLYGCGCDSTRAFLDTGVSFSNVTGDEADSFEGKTGFHAGAGIDLPVNDEFSVQPGLSYSTQGADYSDSEFTGTYKLNYLNLPVLARYEVSPGLTLEAGPQIGLLLSAKDEYEFSGSGGSMEEDVKDFTKNIDFGVNIGAGYTFDNGININAHYNLGLSDLNDNDEFAMEGVKWRNSVIQVSLAYYFKLGDIKGESKD